MLERECETEISVTLTEELMQELDSVVKKEKVGRSEVIREATKQFIEQKKARELRDEMEKGYTEMATINFAISSECTHVEAEAETKSMEILGG
ncbi:CopG family ribbon-helix-helix protein [Listeria sp. PSOL-1]|uniref:CopG family ribbon-helix-helix protein n=1 Tax=Listeria sp. PSOL-1 TaxID=1844999 RepID=UPI0013D1B70E|nr:ribbon-helix-helix protein, CopG family [Listeria sp. PSOL-1]